MNQNDEITFIMTCMGRLSQVEQTLPFVQAQSNSNVIFVDYSCPDHSGLWVQQHFPEAHVVKQEGASYFNLSAARNVGIHALDRSSQGLVCFVDADVILAPSFADWIRQNYQLKHFMFLQKSAANAGLGGLLVVHSRDLQQFGGYDETMAGYGRNAAFMRIKLYFSGLQYSFIENGLAKHLEHDHQLRTRYYKAKSWQHSKSENEAKLVSYIRVQESVTGKKLPDDIYRPYRKTPAIRRYKVGAIIRRRATGAIQVVYRVGLPRLRSAYEEIRGIRNFRDEDIVFFMPVFSDKELACDALARLRQFYPKSRLIVLSDGDYDFPGNEFATRFNAEFVIGPNLYGMDCGGQSLHRMLGEYMRKPAQFLVRLDTDARVDRRFRYLPRKDGLHGHLGRRSRTVQGGCILLTHSSAQRLFNSKIFLSERLLDFRNTWGKYSRPENLSRNIEKKRISYDKILHWGCVEQEVAIHKFHEIFSAGKVRAEVRRKLENKHKIYAIIHPEKNVDHHATGLANGGERARTTGT